MTQRAVRTILILCFALLGAIGLRLVVASGGFEWPRGWEFLELRGHRAVSAVAIGAALSVSGVLLQSMLRNPLASEYILGLSSGAGLGVVVSTYVSYRLTGGIIDYNPPVLAPVAGAIGALLLVYFLSQRRGLVDPTSLILVGVIVGIVGTAFTTLFQHLLPDQGLAVYTRWLLGNISSDTPWPRLWSVLGVAVVSTAVASGLGRSFDAAALGPDEAASVGVRLGRLRMIAFVLAGVLTGSTILLSGPIGFVGLICPHLVRRMMGASHRGLIVGSALAGALLLLVADSAVTMLVLPSGQMPVGVVTALVGGPVFIAMLRSRSWVVGGGEGGGT